MDEKRNKSITKRSRIRLLKRLAKKSVEEGINRKILKLSLPAIVSNITVPLLGICDTAITGHLESYVFLAAIAVGTVMLNVIFWLFGFLRAGTTGLTAEALGRNDESDIRRVLTTGVVIGMVAGLFLIFLNIPIFRFLVFLVSPEQNVADLVERYFTIRICGAPALLATMAVTGWFIGMQNTFLPMILAITVNVINIGLSFIYVFPLSLGFDGVALGTLSADWIGLGLAFWFLRVFRKGGQIWNFSDIIRKKENLLKYFSVNFNLFLRSLFIIAVTMGMTVAGGRLGTLALAVNVIGMQFFQFFSFFMDGFAFSGEALVGLFAGRKDIGRLKTSVRYLLLWTLGMGIVFSTLYGFGVNNISALLSDSQEVIEAISDIRLWIILIPVLSAWAFIFDGFYIGLTKTSKMMLSTLCGAIIFYLMAFVNIETGSLDFIVRDIQSIWMAFVSYLVIRGLILSLLWKSSLKNLQKIGESPETKVAEC